MRMLTAVPVFLVPLLLEFQAPIILEGHLLLLVFPWTQFLSKLGWFIQVFVASDEDGVPILCLVVKEHQRLSAFRLLRNKITEELSSKAHLDVAWTLEAISAAPIIALHPRSDCFV